ncbi:hypothetical protein [Chromobacterium amazonense]|uniref:Uncharacterized protein n=1 Tax=Chromobacterium amazonense TaxID=1382803 RepID=A0ABU8UYC3_9NEIS|nr:hypothetical protein [Chromobacterium amazonense]MDQ4541728.1 hypothetical protein [Chromobacterium amazonense]
MSQTAIHPLQHLMQDLQKRQQGLGEQLQAFQLLQQEIAALKQRAPQDAQARQRLERLSRAMQGELAPLNQRLSQCVESLQGNFKSLEASLKQAGSGGTDKPTATRKAGPMLGRNFI